MIRKGDDMRRSWLEIIADLLRLNVQSRTQLYHSSGLSHKLFKGYMAFLVSKGYIRVIENGYRITVSGMEVRDEVDKMVDKLRPVVEKLE